MEKDIFRFVRTRKCCLPHTLLRTIVKDMIQQNGRLSQEQDNKGSRTPRGDPQALPMTSRPARTPEPQVRQGTHPTWLKMTAAAEGGLQQCVGAGWGGDRLPGAPYGRPGKTVLHSYWIPMGNVSNSYFRSEAKVKLVAVGGKIIRRHSSRRKWN